MKLISVLIFSLTCIISNGQNLNLSNNQTLYVTGDAIVRIQPNQIVLSLGVESRGKNLVETKLKNYKIMQNAILHCKKNNIPEKYIQTDFVNIRPVYQYNNYTEMDYYSVNQSISIVLEDLKIYEELLTELLELGVNQVHNIEFRTTELKKHRQKVRKLAIEAAKEKGKFLAQELGLQLGKIINVRESLSSPTKSFSRHNYANESQNIIQDVNVNGDYGTLSLGMISIKASMTLTYNIIQ